MIVGIDPGPEQSAMVTLRETDYGLRVSAFNLESNAKIDERLFMGSDYGSPVLAVELIGHYGTGMPAGKTVFETCFWIGAFIRTWRIRSLLIHPKTISAHLCGSARAGKPHIRRALMDRFPRTGGGKRPEIGTKADPGPLYGMKTHLWSALAVAMTYHDLGLEAEHKTLAPGLTRPPEAS